MQGLLFTARKRKSRFSPRAHFKAYLWGGVVILVAGGLAIAWPHLFGSGGGGHDKENRGAMFAGNPALEHTPDPGRVPGSSSSYNYSGLPSDSDASDDASDGTSTGDGSQPGGDRTEPAPVAPVATDNRQPSPEAETLIAEAQAQSRRGEVIKARTLFAEALTKSPNAAQRATIVQNLEALCAETILGPKIVKGDPETAEHEVVSGEVLSTIGPKYKIPYALIKRLNGLMSDRIDAGQKLKVVKGPFSVRIAKSTRTLELRLRGIVVKSYPVAIGAEGKTPSGTFTVRDKLVKPTFYPPESMRGRMSVIPGGDPKNPLGTRWIAIGEKRLALGIHGTNEPDSIGKEVSLGCIRMFNADVEFVYDCLISGAEVEIVD